jgi:hypothetical protein
LQLIVFEHGSPGAHGCSLVVLDTPAELSVTVDIVPGAVLGKVTLSVNTARHCQREKQRSGQQAPSRDLHEFFLASWESA